MTKKRDFFSKENCIWTFVLLLLSGLAFWVRLQGIEHITADIETCLIPWSASMKTGYGPSILSTFDGDYNMPYVTVLWLLNYLPGRTIIKVKLFSILFDYLGAIAGGLIVREIYGRMHPEHPEYGVRYFVAAYAAILFYPSAVLNGGYWGQCDMVYVTFLLYLIYALLKDRPALAMILLGCAFSFKLQAILIVPILLIYYWKSRKMSLWHFAMVPVVMELLCIPAIIGGCSVFVPFSVYLRQLGRYPYMYVFYPNIWAIFKDAPYYIFSNVANLSIIAGLGVFAVLVIQNKKKDSAKDWLQYALWSVFFMMCFLPCMHERYGMLLEILAILYAFLDKKYGIYAIIIGAGSYISYLQVTFAKDYFSDKWIAMAYLLCLGFMTYQMLKEHMTADNTKESVNESGIAENMYKKQVDSTRVFPWEQKMIDFVNHYIVWIGMALLTIFAVLIRKPMMECMSPDYLPYLIEVEGNRNTTFYMFIMWILTFFEEKPLFFLLKILCMLGDLLAAGFAAACVYKYYNKRIYQRNGALQYSDDAVKDKSLKHAFVTYFVMLYAPTTYLVSSIWGHVDGLVIALFALAWLAAQSKVIKKKELCCGMCLGMASGLLGHYFVVAGMAAYFVCKKQLCEKNIPRAYGKMMLSLLTTMFIVSLSGLACGYTVTQCLIRLFTWNIQSVWVYYPVMLLVLILCLADKVWMLPAIALEMVLLLAYGQFLYDQILVSYGVLWFGCVVTAILGGYALYKSFLIKYKRN